MYSLGLVYILGSDKPTLQALNIHVRKKLAPKWHDLGMQLLDAEQHDQLKIINCNHPNNVEECCKKMFNYWITVDPDATWDKLLKALETIDYNVLAKSIQVDVLQGKYFNKVNIFMNTFHNILLYQINEAFPDFIM